MLHKLAGSLADLTLDLIVIVLGFGVIFLVVGFIALGAHELYKVSRNKKHKKKRKDRK